VVLAAPRRRGRRGGGKLVPTVRVVRPVRAQVITAPPVRAAVYRPPAQRSGLGRLALTAGGGILGGLLPFPGGAALGRAAGEGLATILGMGAYRVRANSLVDSLSGAQVPEMHTIKEGMRLSHREYVCDIVSSASANTFQVQNLAINPGFDTLFPWLSGIAQNFQEYCFKGLIFEYKAESANALNSTNTALGTVMMCVTYKPTAPSLTSKQQMLQEMWAVDSKPSDNCIAPVECDPSANILPRYLVRGSSVPSGEDAKMYDMGVLSVATTGMQGTSVNVGELWVSYDVELSKPVTSTAEGLYIPYAHYEGTSTVASGTSFAGLAVTAAKCADTIGLTVATASNTLSFPLGTIGKYLVIYFANGTSASITTPGVTPTNGVVDNLFNNGANYFEATPSVTSTTLLAVYAVSIPDSSLVCTLTWGSFTPPTSTTRVDLFVQQLNYAL